MQTKILIGLLLYPVFHIFLWSANPPDVDSINFVTALQHYNIAIDSPHPPGYPAYVGLAKLTSFIVGANHAYQLVNLLLVICIALLVYFSLIKLKLETEAWVSVLVILTHPLLLSASIVPESYVSDACFGASILAWVTFNHRKPKVLLLGLALFFYVFGLFRVVSDILLLPLTMALIWHFSSNKLLTFKVAVLAVIACFLAWLSTIELVGGYDIYKSAVNRVMVDAVKESSVFAGASLANHSHMVLKLGMWLLFSTTPLLLVCFATIGFSKSSKIKYKDLSFDNWLIMAWVLPALAFYILIYYLKPTHLLIFLPVYAICLASSLKKLAFYAKPNVFISALLLLIGLQLTLFFAPNKSWHHSIYRQSYGYLQSQDAAWDELKQAVTHIPNENTLVLWSLGPDTSMYTLRLLNISSPVAIINSVKKTIEFVDPQTMKWQPPRRLDSVSQNQYRYIAVITARKGHIESAIVEINPTETRSLAQFSY